MMKLNEIREIVDFMKETGLSELEYTERHTSIHLKLAPPAPPAPPRPWERFRSAPAAPAEEDVVTDAGEVEEEAAGSDVDFDAAAARVRDTAVKAGSAVFGTVKAGASFLKSKRDEYLAGGTPGACDVAMEDEDESPAQAEEAPVEAVSAAEAVPEAPVVNAPAGEEDEAGDVIEDVKLDTDAARAAVSKTAEAVLNTARAGVALGAAGLRRGSSFLTDLLHLSPGEDTEEAPADASEAEEQTDGESEE